MNSKLSLESFEFNQKDLWLRYESLLKTAKKSLSSTKKLRDLYSNIAGHYAFLVKHYPNSSQRKRLAQYLYQSRGVLDITIKGPHESLLYRLLSLYLQKIPQQIYQYWRFFFISLFFLIFSILIAFILTVQVPELGSSFLGSSDYHNYKSQIESGIQFQNFFLSDLSGYTLSFFIFINNLKVSILALLGGMLMGVGTVYILIKNAFLVGGLLGLYYQSHHFIDFVSTIFQHGFLELMAIALSGASGFLIASPYFFSGRIYKKDLFRKRAKQAVILFIGVISLLFISAFIEGFITVLDSPIYFRLGVITLTIIFFVSYMIYSLRHSYTL